MRGFSRLGNSGGDISKGQTLAAAQNQNRRRGCGRKDSNKYWVNTDPMGVIMASVVWAISISTFFLMDSYVIQPWLGGWDSFWAVFARLWIGVIDVLNLTCHARAMLSNPGAVPKASKPVDASDYARHCHKCDHFKPKRAHHCELYFHHCLAPASSPFLPLFISLSSPAFFLVRPSDPGRLHLRPLHSEDGPPLPLGEQLRGPSQHEVLLALPSLQLLLRRLLPRPAVYLLPRVPLAEPW